MAGLLNRLAVPRVAAARPICHLAAAVAVALLRENCDLDLRFRAVQLTDEND
eukprot:CAMPEP_0195130752 /NCGR_PEP_ID=MMETSP0448-20130528/143809_1 /TAXON_ID=66468 /ORGANISM="Heterocapsa triquestra, Strain CCMP 448" /LENGTH=51 /DNA_ID=CAMNT_0040168671 /DNA_START=1 /DNA_END=153 /DNA_ORIENTATION=-